MQTHGRDPYAVLGVKPGASDAEVRVAHRRLVQLHHPDHNAGSAESARRFEEVQDAYAQIRKLRAADAAPRRQPLGSQVRGSQSQSQSHSHSQSRSQSQSHRPQTPPDSAGDASVDARLAALERELLAAQLARERARAAARDAAREAAATAGTQARPTPTKDARRASDEQLGYITTDDSLSKILADARTELSDLYAETRQQPLVKRVGKLIDELASRLKGDS